MNIRALGNYSYTPVKICNSKNENKFKNLNNENNHNVSFGRITKEDLHELIFGQAYAGPGDDHGEDGGCLPFLIVGILGILGIGGVAINGGCQARANAIRERERIERSIEFYSEMKAQQDAELLKIMEAQEAQEQDVEYPCCGECH